MQTKYLVPFYLVFHSLKPGFKMPSPSFAPSLILSLYALGSRRNDSSVENALSYQKRSRKLVCLCFVEFCDFAVVFVDLVVKP